MKASLESHLVDPIRRRRLRVQCSESDGDDITSGSLHAEDGTAYPIRNGIPRFVSTDDTGQLQTAEAFSFKWKRLESYDSPAFRAVHLAWSIEKYGFTSPEDWATYFSRRQRILDLGCGSGFSSSLWLNTPFWKGTGMWVGVDISEAIDVAQLRLQHVPSTHFIQADALQLPFPDEGFDTIFSEGVLHHTPSTRAALLSAVRVLARGGEFHFYVYRKKGPIRESTDDYIRERIARLSDEEAWDAMREITRLSQSLANLNATVDLLDDVPLLGIKAGRHDVQRLIYWHFAKLYWNNALSFEENVHVNFDWYRPQYAQRQTADQVRAWCDEAGLSIHRFHEQESGFTVRAIKN
jgi:SAM-dependent methyltransferase